MNKIKKFFSTTLVMMVFFLNFNFASAGLLNGFNDPPGCGGDEFLPVLAICGRNPDVAGSECSQFTHECSLGDLVETGKRFVVWIISFVLLIIPLYIMWVGVMMIWHQKFDPSAGDLKYYKEKLFYGIIYFILMLAAWLIVRLVIEVFQVDDSRIPMFLIDDNAEPIKLKNFDTNR